MSVHSFRSGVLISCFFMSTMALAAGPGNYRAHATGAEEVPAVDTRAQGQVTLRLNKDGDGIHYRLNVANIEDVRMAHLHLALPGQNGAIVAWLYPAGPPPVVIDGRVNGVLAAGVITAANLVGPLAGQTLEDLMTAIEEGMVYVNVHTEAVGSGEIRGQLF